MDRFRNRAFLRIADGAHPYPGESFSRPGGSGKMAGGTTRRLKIGRRARALALSILKFRLSARSDDFESPGRRQPRSRPSQGTALSKRGCGHKPPLLFSFSLYPTVVSDGLGSRAFKGGSGACGPVEGCICGRDMLPHVQRKRPKKDDKTSDGKNATESCQLTD